MAQHRYTGAAQLHDDAFCLCLTVDGNAATIDLPGFMRFRIPLELAPSGVYRVPPGAGPSLIELDFSTTPVTGAAHGHGGSGPVMLWPELSFDRAAFEPSNGAYRTGDGHELFLGIRGDGPAAIPYLLDGDEIVRLHPTGPTVFAGERGELVRLGRDELVVERAGDRTLARRFEPYRSQEASFQAEGAELAGTLFMPHGAGPFPAVALVHGASPGERGFYQLYAHHFARCGIAALAYDRRGSGRSTGNAGSSLATRARDAAAAIEWLRRQPGIDPGRAGLWAFSNGTWSAPMVAAGVTPLAFMVLTGAAGVSGAESEIHRKLTELRSWGVGPLLLNTVQRAWRTAYACIGGGQWPAGVTPAQYDALIADLHADSSLTAIPLADYAVENPWLAPIPPNMPAAELQRRVGRSPDLAYDPIDDYARITCPILFLVGEDDPNTPAEGATRIREALIRSGNTRSTVEVVPGAGHYINVTPPHIEGASAAEAAAELHGLRFMPGYLERMAEWILHAVGGQGRDEGPRPTDREPSRGGPPRPT